MTKTISIGAVKIPVTQYASQGNAVLGIRDSGKTYSATYLAEQLYAAKIPFVAFDPSGVWKFLRVPGAGDGLPVVVAGGKSPDLPLTPQSAPEIVRAAMRANVSLVLDFYDIHLSKADWGRIVEQCIRVLLYENGEHGLRHVFIEEAAEFAPQQVSGDKAKVYAEVEKLARIGGNALLGYTLINQRAEQVNKAVLELCDCLFLHRQKGKNSLKSLEKWLDYSQGGGSKEIIQGLPTLPTGECWIWAAGAERASHVKMPTKRTFHPDRRALIANPAVANVQRVDATEFVSELKESLDKFVQEADANDPKKLKARILELERQVAKTPAAPPIDDALVGSQHKEIERLRGEVEDLWRNIRTRNLELNRRRDLLDKTLGHVKAAYELLGFELPLPDVVDPIISKLSAPVPAAAPLRGGASPRPAAATPAPRSRSNGHAIPSDLPSGERKMLLAIVQAKGTADASTLTLLVGLRRSTRNRYLQYLHQKGLIEKGWPARATAAGVAALGDDYEDLPTGDALMQHWLSQLPEGERRMLQELAVRPDGMDVEYLGEAVGLKRSTRNRYIQYLAARQLVRRDGALVIPSEALFG